MNRRWRSNDKFRVLVVRVEVFLDRGDEFGDAVEAAAAQRRVGQFAEPALDQIQPPTRRSG
jgi:hypothetical protein